LSFFFDEMEVNRVQAKHDVNNPGSGRVMEKCGLIKEGIIRQGGRNNTGLCDLALYGMVKEDWEKIKKNKS
jgi:ribosomal-protein-alanine N-acetyltransferase